MKSQTKYKAFIELKNCMKKSRKGKDKESRKKRLENAHPNLYDSLKKEKLW